MGAQNFSQASAAADPEPGRRGVGAVARWTARLASVCASGGLLAAAAGPLAVHAGFLPPRSGFMVCLVGLLLGLPALVLGLVGWLSARGPDARETISSARTGALVGLVLVALLLGLVARGRSVPMIHDISTDLAEPPAFSAAAREADNRDQDMGYPLDTAEMQRAAYPDVKPISLAVAPEEAFTRAQRAATELGWQVTFSDPASGTFEATFTSAVFLFVDDVVVRARPEGGAPDRSRIDVRSRSRVGKSDLGANAARIRAFAAKLAD